MDVDSMVDDLLSTAPMPNRRDGGTVKQLVYSLRTSTRFSKIRDSRAEGKHLFWLPLPPLLVRLIELLFHF